MYHFASVCGSNDAIAVCSMPVIIYSPRDKSCHCYSSGQQKAPTFRGFCWAFFLLRFVGDAVMNIQRQRGSSEADQLIELPCASVRYPDITGRIDRNTAGLGK